MISGLIKKASEYKTKLCYYNSDNNFTDKEPLEPHLNDISFSSNKDKKIQEDQNFKISSVHNYKIPIVHFILLAYLPKLYYSHILLVMDSKYQSFKITNSAFGRKLHEYQQVG